MSRTSLLVPASASRRRDLAQGRPLTVARGVALYTGALLGPGLLLLPGLAAAQAGPASVIAWLGLLGASALLATVFAALGKAYPSRAGVAGYTAAGLGERAGAAAGWCFLAGVVTGAPVVCLIGASYVTRLAGGGRAAECAIAAGLLLVVLALALAGIRATTGTQLVLVALLIVVIMLAVAGAAPSARAANWVPFAPHGWLSLGHAAATLMLSFVGWEAVAPLTARFADPRRQLPKVIAAAFAVTTGLYLGLAVATIAVLGRGAGTVVPLAALLTKATGRAGLAAAAAAAVVLTLGATNAYLTGAAALARELTGRRPGRLRGPADRRFLLLIAVAGIAVIALFAAGVMTTAQLVAVPTTLFLSVYLGCTLSAVRALTGAGRFAAVPALLAVTAVLAFCGWALVPAAAVAATAALAQPRAGGDPETGGDERGPGRDRDAGAGQLAGSAWLQTPAPVAQHPPRGAEQERAEDIQHPLEPAGQRRASVAAQARAKHVHGRVSTCTVACNRGKTNIRRDRETHRRRDFRFRNQS